MLNKRPKALTASQTKQSLIEKNFYTAAPRDKTASLTKSKKVGSNLFSKTNKDEKEMEERD